MCGRVQEGGRGPQTARIGGTTPRYRVYGSDRIDALRLDIGVHADHNWLAIHYARRRLIAVR